MNAALHKASMGTEARNSEPARRTIVIGAGLMGRYHAAATRYVGSTVVAVVDRDIDRARSLARHYRDALGFADLDAALESTKPTIGHVCTPVGSHGALAGALAASGIHALIEKPMALNTRETCLLLEKFSKTGAIACPVHQYAFQRSVEQTLRALPLLGSLRRIGFDIRSAGGGNHAGDRDGIAAEILPHPLSIIQRLLPGVDIGAVGWTLQCSAPGEWLASAHSNGVMLSIAISMGGRPTRFATTVSGTNGTVELDNFHDFAIFLPGTVSRTAKIAQPFVHGGRSLATAMVNLAGRTIRGEHAYPGLRALTRRFHRATEAPASLELPVTPTEAIAAAIARDTLLNQCPGWPHG